MTENQKALKQYESQKHDAAVARLPEFKSLDLTDDPDQVVGLIRDIDIQANKEIAQFVGAIEDQRFVLVGRCFQHLKKIADKGKYTDSIQELGYTYDQVKKQVKFTETYIKQALTRKRGINALLGPGMMGTMARLFTRNELTALGDGKKVHGLRDTDLGKLTQNEVILHIKAARAERDEAIDDNRKLTKQRDVSNKNNHALQDTNKQLQSELDLATKGPKSVEEAHIVCSNIRAAAASISVYIDKLKVMAHSDEVAAAAHESITFAKLKIQTQHDDFCGVETDPKITKELEKLQELFS